MVYRNGDYVPVRDILGMKGGPRILAGTWKTTKFCPTGRLRLIAYAAIRGVSWQKEWSETISRRLAQQVTAIVREIEKEIPAIETLAAAAEEKRRIEYERSQEELRRWKIQLARTQAIELRKKRIEDLSSIVTQWEKEQRASGFLAAMAEAVALESPDAQQELSRKLEQARAVLIPQRAFDRFRSWEAPDDYPLRPFTPPEA